MMKVHILWFTYFLHKVKEEIENQVSGRYNLRRRKDQVEERPIERKKPVVLLATPQQTIKTTELQFGGRIGERLLIF